MTLAYIVPSRGRPRNALKLLQAWESTVSIRSTSIYIVVDDDDPRRADYRRLCRGFQGEQVNYVAYDGSGDPPFTRLGRILNKVSELVLSNPEITAIGFMGDDHRPRTPDWDRVVAEQLMAAGTGIVYGNDLIQGENLPTAVAMSVDIPKALGYLVPDGLHHMFLDNFWRDLGQALCCLYYLPNVVIEHCHPLANKAEWDEGYRAVNNNMSSDADVYNQFLRDTMPGEVERLKGILGR